MGVQRLILCLCGSTLNTKQEDESYVEESEGQVKTMHMDTREDLCILDRRCASGSFLLYHLSLQLWSSVYVRCGRLRIHDVLLFNSFIRAHVSENVNEKMHA